MTIQYLSDTESIGGGTGEGKTSPTNVQPDVLNAGGRLGYFYSFFKIWKPNLTPPYHHPHLAEWLGLTTVGRQAPRSPVGTRKPLLRVHTSSLIQPTLDRGTREMCVQCPLRGKAQSPKMEPYGQGKLRILIVGEAPGEQEDRLGRGLVGPSGQLIARCLADLGIDMDVDCWRTNVLQCRPPDNRPPTEGEVKCCTTRLNKQIRELQPSVILALGGEAVEWFLNPYRPKGKKISILTLRGRVVPLPEYKCYLACSVHPAFILRSPELENLFRRDLASMLSEADREYLEEMQFESGNEVVTDFEVACNLLDTLSTSTTNHPVVFDYETTGLLPYIQTDGVVLLFGFSASSEHGYSIPVAWPGVWTPEQLAIIKAKIATFLQSPVPKVAHNAQFEERWSRAYFGVPVNNVIWDTMLATHILDERSEICSLDFQGLLATGHIYGQSLHKDQLVDEPRDLVARYNSIDCRLTALLYGKQTQEVQADPGLTGPEEFLRCSARVFEDMEQHGIRVDRERLSALRQEVKQEQVELQAQLMGMAPAQAYRSKTGSALSLTSNPELSKLFFSILKLNPIGEVGKSGRHSVKESVLEELAQREGGDIQEFIEGIQRVRVLGKMLSTYIDGVERYMGPDDVVHPQFLLHTTETYRSSSADPNFQNLPKRDKEWYRKIRRMFLPCKGDALLEVDFKAAEVRVLAMYSHDPLLTQQAIDGTDFHKDWAAKLYQIPVGSVSKEQRSRAKNGAVFPWFYGAWYKTVAENVGIPESHAQKVEREFWGVYHGVKRWQEQLEAECYRRGYVETFLGFRRRLPMSRNQLINFPIQATSFHLLLLGLVASAQLMKDKGLRTAPVLEIHDAIVYDLFTEELDAVVDIIQQCLLCTWGDWQTVPMQITWEVGKDWGNVVEVD